MALLRRAADTYHLIVTRRNASEVLLLAVAGSWTVPRVEIERHQRIAEQLTAEALRVWGIETYCLFVSWSQRAEEPVGAVIESVQQNLAPPEGMCWMPSAAAPEYCDLGDASVIRKGIAEARAYANGQKAGAFGSPGWMRELFAWANAQVAPLGLRLTGRFRQLNASPTFALIRLETEGGAVWFKATGEPNAHELAVTVKLAQLFPQYLPPVFGIRQDWNGWLAAEAAGVSLDEAQFRTWERVATDLAEFQIGSIEKADELAQCQLKDLRCSVLLERLRPFMDRMREFMAAQEKADPAPLGPSELATLSQTLKDCCAVLESIGLPDTVGHTDFNPGNIIVGDERCTFLDWAEGCIASPVLTFEYLRVYLDRCAVDQPAAAERLACAYLRPWLAFYAPEDLRRALAVAPLIAIYAFAVSTDAWHTLDLATNATLAAYFRSLTRRMHREAIQVSERSEPCLS